MNQYLNKELAELIGAFIGDGFIGKYGGSHHTEFVGHKVFDMKYITYLSSIIKKYFDVKIRFKFENNAMRMIIRYKELYEYFKDLGFPSGVKNKTVKIPDNLYNSDLIPFVVRGIFDTDGFLFIDKRKIYRKPYARIGFHTKSKSLINQIKILFLKRNYKIYMGIDKRADIYRIEIYGNTQIKRWLKEFGFSNKEKKNYASVAQLVER